MTIKPNILTYKQKKKIADQYLNDLTGLGWDDLPSANSLDDTHTKDEIIGLCNERLEDEPKIIYRRRVWSQFELN